MSRASRALVDGVTRDVIAIDDRGLQYRHGMFETCRIVDGTIPLWRYHRDRLDATAPHLPIPLDLRPTDAEVAQRADTRPKVNVTAGQCFLTNAIIGVWPVTRIVCLAGAGLRTGRITQQIGTALEARFGFGRTL